MRLLSCCPPGRIGWYRWGMDGWSWALLLKPIAGLALIFAYWLFIIRGLRWLYPRLPKNKLVDALFRERGNTPPEYGPDYESVGKRRASGSGTGTELQ